MGKQQDSYNKIKPTKRQIKRQKQTKERYGKEIKYSCENCLMNFYNNSGYISDEELNAIN